MLFGIMLVLTILQFGVVEKNVLPMRINMPARRLILTPSLPRAVGDGHHRHLLWYAVTKLV